MELGRAEMYLCGVYWGDAEDRLPSLFLSLVLNQMLPAMYFCLLIIRDEKTLILT